MQQSDFYFTNSAAEQIKIKWLSGDADTAVTGTLSVTMDNGNNWQVIAPAVPLVSKYFDWIVPDTNTFLQFRMNVNNTAFFSPQILLGPLTRIHVDYLCTDSFRLSWNQQQLAQSYQLSVLRDSAFMIPFLQTNDTFIVLQRNTYPENIFAVQPLLGNTTKSARSFAVDITNQGVGCMYSSFYGIPVGDMVELTLELSFPQGMDSIVIEKINANSIFEKGVTSIFPSASSFSYTVYDKSPTEGANNYRAKIWFGGHFIYTETVTIIYVGKQWLFLYPNPLIAGQSIFYSVKESTDELLFRIYSVQGKMLSQYFINSSGSFSMNHFSPGIYFYSLLNNKNEQLQQGKLLLY
nr:T9SS type A sorting domain-containing protein [Bacteroidota bacterium]